MNKPQIEIEGKYGNVFHLIGMVSNTIRNAGYPEEARKFCIRAIKAKTYDEIINILPEYVEVKNV
jgi:hypothetical protein